MDESKLAELDREKLQEISELEERLAVILIAYDNKASLNEISKDSSSL